jgi:hypothetical protein
MVGLPSLKEE